MGMMRQGPVTRLTKSKSNDRLGQSTVYNLWSIAKEVSQMIDRASLVAKEIGLVNR